VYSSAGEGRPIALDTSLHCPSCGATVPLAGPVLSAACHSCRREIAIAPELWQEIVAELDERSFEAGSTRTAAGACRRERDGVHLFAEWSRVEIACRRCKSILPPVEPGASGAIDCKACGMPLPILAAPPWLRSAVPTALELYGIETVLDAAALEPEARRWWIYYLGTPRRVAAGQSDWLAQEVILASRRAPLKESAGVGTWMIVLALCAIAFVAYTLATTFRASPGKDLVPHLRPRTDSAKFA
jgi:hypothetical protein